MLHGSEPWPVSPERVNDELKKLLASREFANSERLARLLRYIVERTLAGDRDGLKESVIGVEVFDRSADYDPKSEPIVRTEARRLRARLDAYYQDPSRSSPVRIQIPKGSYVALFEAADAEKKEDAVGAAEEPRLSVSPRPSSAKWRVAVAAGGITAAVLFVVFRPHVPVLDHAVLFTAQRGAQSFPHLSPAGDMMAFDWQAPEDLHRRIYVQRLDGATPSRLTEGAATERCPTWSRDGARIAFLRDAGPSRWAIFTRALVGSSERKWAELAHDASAAWLDWSPDGKWFAFAEPLAPGRPPSIVAISLETGERRIITTPPARWRGDGVPVFSPDSSGIVFRRTETLSGQEDLYEIPLKGGTPKRLTFDHRGISGLAFTPDGGLIFSSKRTGTIRSLWWMGPGGGGLRRLTSAVADTTFPTVSRDGKHFAFSRVVSDVNIWKVSVDGRNAAPLIDSDLPDSGAQFSPDGQRIAFQSSRSGSAEIWICSKDGLNVARLTDGGGAYQDNPRWSPDGKQIAFEWHKTGNAGIYLVGSDGGPVRALAVGAYNNQLPSWSQDGRFVYFSSDRSGQAALWKAPIDGGSQAKVTDHPGFETVESHDGKYLFWSDRLTAEIWRQPLENGALTGSAQKMLTNLHAGDWGLWALGRNGIYYIQRQPGGGDASIDYRDFTAGTTRTIHVLSKPPVFGAGGLAVSPDETAVLFAQVDRDAENIFVQ